MAKQDQLDVLRQDPRAAALLADKARLTALLQSPEARTLAGLLEGMGGDTLKQAASGDAAALGQIAAKLRADPLGAKAMETMEKKTQG